MTDEKTVACVAEETSSDGFNKVYILNTDSEKFNLSGTITGLLKAGGGEVDYQHVFCESRGVLVLLKF